MVAASGLGSGSSFVHFLSTDQFISGIDYFMRRKVCRLLKVHFICVLSIGFILFIVLWDIAHVSFL